MKLHIADSHNIRQLANIKSEARRLHRKGKLKLLIIDYLQLITTNIPFQNRHLEIGYITKELKNLAKELGIPVILLSQLSRALKGDKGTEPVLNDLKESGEIENDADIVLFIHKPDYYNPQAADKSGEPWEGRGKLIIAKYREGARNQFIIFHHDQRYKKIFDRPIYQPVPQKEIKNYYEKKDELPF
jgi:replicative DNA helicase